MKRTKASKAQLKRQRRRRRLRKLKAACLSLGMATAWGGEAEAAPLQFKVTANPTRTISNAYVYFSNNATTGFFRSLGTLPANETSMQVFTFNFGDLDPIVDYLPRPGAFNGDPDPGFVIMGVYEQDDLQEGVALSSQSTAPIDDGSTWDDLFNEPSDPSYAQFEEAEIVDSLNNGDQFSPLSTGFEGAFLYFSVSDIPNPLLRTPYGQQATLIAFSTAVDVGTAIVEIVPEPASWGLVVSAAGAVLLVRRRD